MKLLKLTFRNLMGNGLKTWLNVFVLSISFVLIIFMQSLLQGWDRQAIGDMVKWEIAGGQYWSGVYDPYDPFSFDSAAANIPAELTDQYNRHEVEPVLISSATIYPSGRSMAVMMKGIRPDQKLLSLPTHLLKTDSAEIPAIIGSGMAAQAGLKENDIVTLRWRDVNGTFEARDIHIAGIFRTFVPAVDLGQVWLPLQTMQQMLLKPGKATMLVKSVKAAPVRANGWNFKDAQELTQTVRETLKSKMVGQSVFYVIFLLLALLAIFDTQTLSIFRRQKEIGTFVALGMTQREVVGLFTLEGTMNAFLAILLGAVYGVPLFIYYARHGIPMPSGSSEFGLALADKIYPAFPIWLIMATILFIIFITALISYLPARKIAGMKPTDAIRGKIQ